MLTFHLWFNILLIGGPIEKFHKYEEKFQNKIFYKKNWFAISLYFINLHAHITH